MEAWNCEKCGRCLGEYKVLSGQTVLKRRCPRCGHVNKRVVAAGVCPAPAIQDGDDSSRILTG